MELAKIKVRGACASVVYRKPITSGMVGVTVAFEYADPLWDGLKKTAVFTAGGVTRDVLNADGVVTVPAEVVVAPGAKLKVGVYGTDGDGNLVIPTAETSLGIIDKGADPSDDPGTNPDLPIWAQLQADIEELKKTGGADQETIKAMVEECLAENPPEVKENDPTVPDWAKQPEKPKYTAEEVSAISQGDLQDATNEALAQAKASGEFDGAPGEPGKDGYTPVKGVDYFDGAPGKDGADGKDGYTPVKGVDYFDGKDGYTPIKGVDYFDGQPGYTPQKGVDYFDGAPGDDYVLTDADKTEIAEIAAELVEVPDSSQNANQGDMFSGYDRFYDSIARMQVNPTEPLDIATYDGSNKPTHPKVLYFENGWAGHKFWMAYSPFPGNNDAYENPCIAYSEDGINFISDGITNPIEDTPMEDGVKVGYNSDPHIVLVSGVMECWWRTHYQSGTNSAHEVIYRKTSTDGINWSEKEELFRVNDASAGSCLSPAVIYEDGIYKIWTVYKQQAMRYYESTTGADWTHIRDINVDNPDYPTYKVWHIDVIHTEKGYEFVGCYHPTNNYDDNKYIYYAVSADNITYSERVLILMPGPTGNYDATELYRPSIIRVDQKVMIYYGCRNGYGNWKIGMIEAPNPYLFNAVLKNGLRFASLESRIAAIESGSGGSGDATTTHTITYKLTNCTSSNGSTSIPDGASYTAQIGTTTGYILGNAVITMGGADVTATTWDADTATVTIESVKGDVVITCDASAQTEVEQIALADVSWTVGGINGDTGEELSDTKQVGSSPFTVNEYAGQPLAVVFDAIPFDYSQKVIFYDAEFNRVGSVYGKSQKLVAAVPSNAVYARLSSAVDGFTSAQVLGCQLSEMSTIETLSSQYYNAADGAIKSDAKIDAVKVSTGDADFAVISGGNTQIVSCAAYNSDNAFVRGLAYYMNNGQRHIDLDGCAYLGLNYNKGATNLYYRGVNLGQLIGETAYSG